jgi:hypothetical protein
MAIVNTKLTLTQIDGLLVPGGKSYAVTNILVCNNGTNTASFDMHLVPSGSSLDNSVTRVINNLTLPAAETFSFDSEKIVLEAGDRIIFVAEPQSTEPTAQVGDTDLATTISYLEV